MLLGLLLLAVGAAAAGRAHDDAAARRTMEEFAGFPASDDGGASPLRVDSDNLGLLLLAVGAAAAGRAHDDAAARRTMEEFAGFPASDDGGASPLRVDSDNLRRQIDELASFSDSPAPSVKRVLYSDKDVQARRYIKGIMKQLGLVVREEAVGNIFGRWVGSEAGLGAVATGSHVDAIPFSGKYDGVVGVLGALEEISVLPPSPLHLFCRPPPSILSDVLPGHKDGAGLLPCLLDGSQRVVLRGDAGMVGSPPSERKKSAGATLLWIPSTFLFTPFLSNSDWRPRRSGPGDLPYGRPYGRRPSSLILFFRFFFIPFLSPRHTSIAQIIKA